jgi:hypothetical protein
MTLLYILALLPLIIFFIRMRPYKYIFETSVLVVIFALLFIYGLTGLMKGGI